MACCLSFLLWLALLQTSLAVNVPGPNGTVVTQILSATSSNPEVKVVEDRDLGKILVYPPQPKEFTVKIIARIMYPDDQYLEKISTMMVGATGVTIESDEIRNSLILATLKVAPGASGGRFSITYENEDNPNHKGCNVRLLPVEVKVNNTDKEEDDLVAVSKGTDEDLATDFSVKVSGMGGLTADLKVKGADGGIKFKDKTLTLTDGVEAKTKLWGISPSSDKDKTIIVITLKKDGQELGKIEEELTVFEGVRVEYDGKFYTPVDTRDYRRRPSDGKTPVNAGNYAHQQPGKPPLPLGGLNDELTHPGVIAQDTGEVRSQLVFNKGDQGVTLRKRAKDPEVKVRKIILLNPKIEIIDSKLDPMVNQKVHSLGGNFVEIIPGGGNDYVANVKFLIGEKNLAYFEVVSGKHDINLGRNVPGGSGKTQADILTDLRNAEGKPDTGILIQWIKDAYSSAGNNDGLQRMAFQYHRFSRAAASWKNDKNTLNKKNEVSASPGAKGLLGWAELNPVNPSNIASDGHAEVYFEMRNFYEWTLTGDLDEGYIETK